MSDSAVLVPVPFYAPVRTSTGNAGTFFNFSQTAKRTTRVESQERPAMPEVDAGLVYDQSGLCVGDSRLGWIVNIWV